MKKTFVAALSICTLLFTSCNKDSLAPKQNSTTEKIMGKWMLVKYQEQTYNAANTLIFSNERLGDQSDSLVFKQDGKLYTYSDTEGRSVDEYQVANDQQIRIEMEDWNIAKLTDTEFELLSEEADPVTKEKDVVKAFLKRP